MVTFYNVEGDKIDEIQLPSGGEGEDSTGEAATIPNKEQEKLPVAGGMGAIWFSAGGLALASAAALLYFKQRKRGRNNTGQGRNMRKGESLRQIKRPRATKKYGKEIERSTS